MNDGTGNNNSFRFNAPSLAGGGGETLAPASNSSRSFFHQKMLGVQSRLKQMHVHQQQIGSMNGGDESHSHGTRQQMSPVMVMNDDRASFSLGHNVDDSGNYQQSTFDMPTFANNSDNHYNFPQSNDFQPEKIQMIPSRGRQERGHEQRLTRSLPNTSHGLLHNSNTHQLSQSLLQFQASQQPLVQRQELVSEQSQNNDFQPEKIQILPSRGLLDRGHQQNLTRSLPNTPHYEHNNGGLLHDSNNRQRLFSHSLPQSFQANQQSLEALRADIQRQELELEQLEKKAGYSSSVPSSSSIIQQSSTSLFSSQIQKQPTRLPSDQLFHSEDPLGFCLDVGTTGNDVIRNNKNPLVPVNWQQQQQQQNLQQPEQMSTSCNNNHAQESREDDRKTVFPLPLSQSKRRRMDSDQIEQMLYTFLSESYIESPGEVAGNKLLIPSATSTTDDDADSGIPDLPLNDENVSMTSQSDDESTKLLVSDDKKSDHGTADATPKDTSQHIITPSTATISKLTAEIRTQAMMQHEQKTEVRATSPSNETQDSSSSEPNQDKPTTSTTIAARLAEIASVMAASQTSQQNIHDWDKKFGLKRAHSKTMRESCRSRKKVLDFLKAEISEGKESVLSTLLASAECFTVQENSESAETDCIDAMTSVQEDGEPESLSSSSSHSSSGDCEEEEEEEDQSMDVSVAEEVKDDEDHELERMFRRASLECVEGIVGEGFSFLQRALQSSSETSDSSSDKSNADTLMHAMPLPEDTDRVQYHARCA